MDLTFVVGVSILAHAHAEVAELADAHDSNSCSYGSVGSIPTFGIIPSSGKKYSPLRD
jgi:hypothetical protein